jgi:hypothetical protein
VTARVQQIATLGSYVKLSLETTAGEALTVHMPRREFDDMHLAIGDPVLVDLDSARVFVEDYAI